MTSTFNGDKIEDALLSDNMNWSFAKPTHIKDFKIIYIFPRGKELFKVAKGDYDTISYFKTLEEAKAEVDDMRDSHQFDYGYIIRMEGIYVDQHTVKDEREVGYWGEYYEDSEVAKCNDCETPLDHLRDGTTEEGHRCNNCYWEDQGGRDAADAIITPDYRVNFIEEETHKKKKKKKKHKRLVVIPNKLCKSMECKLIKDEEWNMKCAVCDGYYKDDGLHDILDVNDDENCFCHLCGQGGIKSKNLVIMKHTGSVTCKGACLEDDFCECDVCGEELHEDESFRQLYGSNSMTFCKECYADRL